MRTQHVVIENPFLIPMNFRTQQEVRKRQKLHFTLFSCRYHSFENATNNRHLTPVEHC